MRISNVKWNPVSAGLSRNDKVPDSPDVPSMAYPTLADCWNARSRGCFWVAEQFGYRIGSLISWGALRLHIRPNTLSFFALLSGLSGVAVACWPGVSRLTGGSALVVGLLGSCCFDCADGVVARLSGCTTAFGGLLDKIGDMTLSLVICGSLGVVALGQPDALVPVSLQPALLVWSLIPKQLLSVISWLKSALNRGLNRAPDHAVVQTWAYRAKRFAGNITDDAPYRLGVGLSWAAGCYWGFALIFHTAIAAVALGYLWNSQRSFAHPDLTQLDESHDFTELGPSHSEKF
jgi:phosphatidylglycerophosphate synthase